MRELRFFINIEFIFTILVISLSFILIGISLFLSTIAYLIFGIFLLLSCIIWLRLRKSFILEKINVESNPRLFLILVSLFFIFFTYSLIALRDGYLYERPIQYFLATSIISCIISLEILLLPSRKQISLLIIQIIALGLSLEISQALVFPTVIGVDPWYHQAFTIKMLEDGHIPLNSSYSFLPIFHLVVGTTMTILGLDYKVASILSISLVQVIMNVLIVYCIGRFLFNNKIGLLASLLLVVANYNINMGFWAIPNTLGFVFVIIILYLLMKFRAEKTIVTTTLTFIFMIALVMTHTVASACMAIILTVWIVSDAFYSKFSSPNYNSKVSFGLVIFFPVLILSWWSYASGHLFVLESMMRWGFSVDFLSPVPANESFKGLLAVYTNSIPTEERIFNLLGLFIYSAFAIVGYLYMVSKKGSNSNTFCFVVSGIIVLVIPFLTLMLGLTVLEQRWFALAQILCAIPLAISIIAIISMSKRKIVQGIALTMISFIITFLMIMSPVANIDSPLLSSNTSIRYALTDGEITGASYIIDNSEGNISSDYFYLTSSNSIFRSYYNLDSSRVNALDNSIINKSFIRDGTIIIIRSEIIHKPFVLWASPYKIDYDPNEVLNSEKFCSIYQNGDVKAYI